MKIRNDKWKVTGRYPRIYTTGEPHSFQFGTVMTDFGFVEVYYEVSDNTHLTLRFIWRGVCYTRTLHRSFSELSIAVWANRFANEIVENH